MHLTYCKQFRFGFSAQRFKFQIVFNDVRNRNNCTWCAKSNSEFKNAWICRFASSTTSFSCQEHQKFTFHTMLHEFQWSWKQKKTPTTSRMLTQLMCNCEHSGVVLLVFFCSFDMSCDVNGRMRSDFPWGLNAFELFSRKFEIVIIEEFWMVCCIWSQKVIFL